MLDQKMISVENNDRKGQKQPLKTYLENIFFRKY